jgi:hypothetical protein
MLLERGTAVPDAPPGVHPRNAEAGSRLPRAPRRPAVPWAAWSPGELIPPGPPDPGLPAGVPVRAHQVTVRYSTASGHQTRDVIVMTDDYPLRRDDGTLDDYLDTVVRPALKRAWYPFPVDTGDRWVLPVMLRGGRYVEDPEAPSPLDASSASFPVALPQPAPSRPRGAAARAPRRPRPRSHQP